ncbi:MAG: TRAP transporter small permease [Burkholderiaceae bacterium]|jgi:TRAP-type C4-dicarboxylate transport system permease small subunit|nr:TRAP transporter small permease [Burkholderiales bacterium]MCZ8108135.1 TRAP transporter small permease [Burkholderiales bacterium]MCZ8337061.1 TRAP transporter small permease [Burkholderiaceae bacterium]
MRRILDALYDGAVWLAAVMMVGVLVMVLLSIAGRQLHFHVPGTDAYAGYLMAGAGFLALAHTLRRGEHIRVTLLIQALRGAPRRALEVWSLSVATLLASAFAFYAIKLTWESRVFNDVSTSSDATPLWIPQLSMAAGAVLLVVALLDEWVQAVRGREIARATDAEPLRNE